ncbi:MAG: type IV pilin protein [Azoarcus sp.]|nr:type IV pilin protein [Azoarcus sp.]
MIKTRRATAAACLLEMSQALERFYTVNLTYVGAALPDIQCSRELANHYIFALPNPAAREYQLTATPQGAQNNNDPYACGTLTMDQAGQKGADKNVNDCWR